MVIVATLGAGGMGVVYSAYDPKLDRKIALKMIRAEHSARGDAHARLLREAQALAKLAHPNVVAVHDVGAHGDNVWIAMEFVEGETVEDWLAARPRGWREVLGVFRQALDGLAAAHAAGLLHRDIKPANIMIGADGRARVMDFGLARVGDDDRERSAPVSGVALQNAFSLELTQAGALMGTPAYMAPEQLQGASPDERTDLFSLCVALWEALYGERPFAGATLAELVHSVTTGSLETPPTTRRVPRWLHRVVARGLEVERDSRWRSAAALRAALTRDPTGRARAALLLGALTLGLAGALALALSSRPEAPPPCERAGDELLEVWDPARRDAVERALLATEAAYARDTWERIAPKLERYAESWREQRVAACAAHRAKTRSDQAQLVQLACLAERRASLEAMVQLLSRADASVVAQAVQATASLPPLERCSDLKALRSGAPPPEDPETAVAVQRVREQLARARASQDAGRFADALALLDSVADEVDALEYPPLRAELALRRGDTHLMGHETAKARDQLSRAIQLAIEHDHDEVAAHALVRRVFVTCEHESEPRRAHGDLEFLESFAARFSGDRELLWLVANNSAVIYQRLGELDRANERYTQALAASRAPSGAETYRTAFTLNNLASFHLDRGDLRQGIEHYELAIEALERTLGARHPYVRITVIGLALARAAQRRPRLARASLERARELGERDPTSMHAEAQLAFLERDWSRHAEVLEELLAQEAWREHPLRAAAMIDRGRSLLRLGDEAGARVMLSAGEALLERGAETSVHADGLLQAGILRLELGDPEGGRAAAEAAIERLIAEYGASAPSVATARLYLADALSSKRPPAPEDDARIESLLRAAEASFAERYPPLHPMLAELNATRGEWQLARGRVDEARQSLRAAQRVRGETLPETNPHRAHLEILLARADAAAGVELGERVASLRAALRDLEELSPGFADWARADKKWLKEHLIKNAAAP